MYKVSRGGESISGPLGSRTLLLLLAIIGAFHDLPVLPRQEARQGCSLTESTRALFLQAFAIYSGVQIALTMAFPTSLLSPHCH